MCSALDKKQFHMSGPYDDGMSIYGECRVLIFQVLLVYVRITFPTQLPEPRTVRLLNQLTIPVELSL